MNNQENIWIGPDLFIPWIEFDPRNKPLFEIDTKSLHEDYQKRYDEYYDRQDPLNQLFNKLETECLVDCCGVNALRFWPEDITRAVQAIDKADLLKELRGLQEKLVNSSEEIVVYHRLNQLFAKITFLQLIDYLINELSKYK